MALMARKGRLARRRTWQRVGKLKIQLGQPPLVSLHERSHFPYQCAKGHTRDEARQIAANAAKLSDRMLSA
jgi:hypothetical protein